MDEVNVYSVVFFVGILNILKFFRIEFGNLVVLLYRMIWMELGVDGLNFFMGILIDLSWYVLFGINGVVGDIFSGLLMIV